MEIISLFENFIHYFWRDIINNFVHFNSKWMYIVKVYRDRIIFMLKFFKTWKFVILYDPYT